MTPFVNEIVLQAPTSEPLNESKDQVVSSQQIAPEIQPTPFVYSRDFLLGFQQLSYPPIEGLLPEVLPGYVDPNKIEEDESNAYSSPRNFNFDSPFQKNFRSRSRFSSPMISTPHSTKSIPAISKDEQVPSFNKDLEQPTSTSLPNETSPTSTPVMKRAKNDKQTRTPAGETRSDTGSDTFMTPASKLEWQLKKRKEKPKESDPKRLRARQKQLDIGMNTVGYQRYLDAVPVENRTLRIPDIHQVCSKRSWDGQVRIFIFSYFLTFFRFENGEENSTSTILQVLKPMTMML
jgi:hypothetical protein